MTTRSLRSNVLQTGAARVYTFLAGLAATVITARYLGPAGQGELAAAMAWAGVVATFAGLSLGQVLQRDIPSANPADWLPASLGNLLAAGATLSMLAILAALVFYRAGNADFFADLPVPLLWCAAAFVPILLFEQYFSNLLAAAGGLPYHNRAQYLGRSTGLILLLLCLVPFRGGSAHALASLAFGQFLALGMAFKALYRLADHRVTLDGGRMKPLWSGALRLHPNTVATFLLHQGSILILSNHVDKSMVGYFQIAWQMAVVPLIIPQAAALAVYARLPGLGPDKVWPEHRRLVLILLALSVAIYLIAWMAAPLVITLVAGEEFLPAVPLFRKMAPVLIGLTFAQAMTPQWISRGLFLTTTLLTVVSALASITLQMRFVPEHGVMAAVWANLIFLGAIPVIVQGAFMFWCERHVARLPSS